MIALRALGKAEINTATGKLTPSQGIVFATALYLFLERSKAVSREALAEVLWPGAADAARQHRLRQTLLELKHAGIPVQANRDIVSVPAEVRHSDLDVLFIHGAGDIDALESLQFLPGYAPSFSRPFSDWLDSKRSEVTAAAGRQLINDIRKARARGDWIRVERLAVKCMDVDPFNEEAVLARAEASAMRGAKREAVTILDRYVADLGPGGGDIKLPASLMRKRIAERVPDAALLNRTEGIFVGRETDMQLLTAVLDDARAGRGRCCVLWGDPGIGKSRLALELGKFGELQGVQVRRVACRRGDAQRPLSVFVEAVPLLREMRGALGCSPDTMADLQRLTQFDVRSETKHALEMDPQSIFELIRLAIFDLIDAVSEEQPLMLVVEDVHWMDAASARVLGQIADWAVKKHLLLLFTSRMRENPLLDACTRSGLVAHQLRPLSSEAATALVEEMFDANNERRDDEFLEWCQKVGDGNPFFLHELVKQWMETKQRHVIPPSLTTVIRDRFSRLSSEGTQLLQACSILGEHSTLPRVEKMLQQEPYMLLGALNELSKASMLSPERKPSATSPDFKLAPKHDLISMVALEELDPHAEVFLNRRAAEVLEPELGSESQDTALLWACAGHWQKAGDAERAFRVAKRYAEFLLDVGLQSDAADALLRARDFCPTKHDAIEVLQLAVPALQSAHRWKDVISTIETLKGLKNSGDFHDDLEIMTLYAQWRTARAVEKTLDSALECVSDTSAAPKHRLHAANLAMKIGSDQAAPFVMDWIYAAVSPLREISDIDQLSLLELDMVYYASRGDIARTEETIDQLTTHVRASANAFSTVMHFANCSTALRLVGREAQARDLLVEAIGNSTSKRAYASAKYLSIQLVRLYLIDGDVKSARARFDSVKDWELPQEDKLASEQCDYLHARLLLLENRVQEASNIIAPLTGRYNDISTAFRGPVIATAIRIALASGQKNSSIADLVSELERIHMLERATGWNDFETYSLYLGLTALGQREHALALIRQYLSIYRRDKSIVPTELADIASKAGEQSAPD